MAKTTMEIVLSTELKDRLQAAANEKGKSIYVFIQEALFTYVEDVEDGVMSYVALKEEGLEHFMEEGAIPVALDDSIYEASRKTA